MRIALGIEYQGTHYCGWQKQPQGCAVQDYVDRSLSRLAGEPIESVCAGRTDAGVHALQQVVHFDTQAVRNLHAWVRGTNAGLPKDIVVQWARRVSDDFHARYSAHSRTYCYVLYNHAVRPGLWGERAGWCYQPLDLVVMQQAADMLLGERDFSSFRSSECQALSAIRTLQYFGVLQKGQYVYFHIRANAFLHHMVRNLVSLLVEIGKKKYPPQWALEVLEKKNRTYAPATFAAQGLYLHYVQYPEVFGLPVRHDLPMLFE